MLYLVVLVVVRNGTLEIGYFSKVHYTFYNGSAITKLIDQLAASELVIVGVDL